MNLQDVFRDYARRIGVPRLSRDEKRMALFSALVDRDGPGFDPHAARQMFTKLAEHQCTPDVYEKMGAIYADDVD